MFEEKYIRELNGFLKAFQVLSGQHFRFGARSYPYEGGLVKYLEEKFHTGDIASFTKTQYPNVCEKVTELLFNGAVARSRCKANEFEYYTKMTIEFMTDAFGYAAGSEGGNKYPLIEGPVYEVKMPKGNITDYFCFFLEVDGYVIQTFLENRRPN